ncbi:response regulator [Flavobacterium litorale]|uniref:Response regulator n=1 Tax=Flavobacterium litorale TaxID=2856519 RepID=A0ABX8V6V9_9FLAO|nr:response regulator [Flavobacterium litorale]QYJ68222.1 response regulator [Flavobacterium litorale]
MRTIKSLYVIDDDKIYHFLLKNLLKQNGIDASVRFFCDGAEAIDYIKDNNNEELPDLILLDVNMPIMNGWQFLEEYSALVPKLVKQSVIYMISSSNNEVDINKAKDFNEIVRDYYLKPICKDDLNKIFLPQDVQ